jgi:hypothetical protein
VGEPSRAVLGIRSRTAGRTHARLPLRRLTAGRRLGRARGDEGMTIIELVIAFTVLMAVLVPTALLLQNVIGQAATSRERLTALSVAEKWVEKLNNSGPPLTTGVPETNVAITETPKVKLSTISYDVHAEFTWSTAEGKHPDLCTSGVVPTVLELQVWVTWPTSQKVTDSAIINYPPNGLPTDGFLAVQLNGDKAVSDVNGHTWATRVLAIPITIKNASTNPTSFSAKLYPDSYGCLFEEVPPGNFTVTLSDPSPGTPTGTSFGAPDTPSWVANANETTTYTTSAQTVNVDLVTRVTLQYDEGTVVNVTYPTTTSGDGGVVCPGAGSILCLSFGQSPTSASKPSSTPIADLGVLTASGWTMEHPSGTVRLVAASCAGSTRCIAVGAGKSGAASVSSGTTTPTFGADSVPSGVTALTGITCPTSTTCFAYGSAGTSAAILSAVGGVRSGSVSWTKDTLPTGTTTVANLACPSRVTCYAAAAKSGTPLILTFSSATNTWSTETLPTGTTAPKALNEIACPLTTTCYAVGSKAKATSGEVYSLTKTHLNKFVVDTVPSTVTVVTQLSCPSGTVCYAVGSKKKTSTTSGAVLSLTTAKKWVVDTTTPVPTGLFKVTCPSTTTCVVLGSTSSSGLILWRTGGTTFGHATLPSITVSAVTGVSCPSTTHCFVTGVARPSGVGRAVILSGSGTSTWTSDTLPSSLSPVYLSGAACSSSGCAAVGGTETGAFFLSGAPTGTTWANTHAPSGLAGMYLSNIPISVANSNLKTSSPLEVTAPSSDVSKIGPLYPFTPGYTVGAGKCAYELTTASTSAGTVPGATTATALLPMGLLAIKVATANGAPQSGATVTVQVSDTGKCATLTPLSGTNPASYSLGKTDYLGLTGLDVMYDTYSVTVKATDGRTASKTISVTPTGLTVTGKTLLLPTPVVVTVT